MRISDWSADVCSSDLTGSTEGIAALLWPTQAVLGRARLQGPLWPDSLRWTVRAAFEDILFFEADAGAARRLVARLEARKSVVSGKSGSVRVDLGCCRILKKKKITKQA